LVNLIEIHFYNNKIKEIDPNLFIGLVNLKEIYFGHNQIKEMHPNLFNGLVNLIEIHFSDNQIKKIHPDYYFPSSYMFYKTKKQLIVKLNARYLIDNINHLPPLYFTLN